MQDTQSIIGKVIEYSYKNRLAHIPSALSMLTYVDLLFQERYIKPYRDKIIIGKPFGSQSYYLVWQMLGYITSINHLHPILKHSEIEFVNFSGESLGNTLGIAAGVAMATSSNVWVNLSDAALQMGSELEAIQFIGHNKLNNIIVSVDYNNSQVTGRPSDILSVTPVINFFRENGWDVIIVNGHDREDIKQSFHRRDTTLPSAYIYQTVKGHGVDVMERDPKYWHYRCIDETDFRHISKQIQ